MDGNGNSFVNDFERIMKIKSHKENSDQDTCVIKQCYSFPEERNVRQVTR
ncbi:MAG: hypothetical protein LBS61_02805 [Endomicrobium sp.]|jgi:hypothetical protein|nr:hypothetical protein [Endomicrobium sp.]